MVGSRKDKAVEVKQYFNVLRPGIALIIIAAYAAPMPAAVVYSRTLPDRDSLLFWFGGDRYALFGLVCMALIWFSHAMAFALTKVVRFRPLVLKRGADYAEFNNRSREYFILWSVLVGLYLAFYCFLECA